MFDLSGENRSHHIHLSKRQEINMQYQFRLVHMFNRTSNPSTNDNIQIFSPHFPSFLILCALEINYVYIFLFALSMRICVVSVRNTRLLPFFSPFFSLSLFFFVFISISLFICVFFAQSLFSSQHRLCISSD